MRCVDGTRELMRHDLAVWPRGACPAADEGRPSAEAGITRRGFLVGAGFAAAVVVAGGLAWRVAPLRDWLDEAGDKLGVDIPGVSSGSIHADRHAGVDVRVDCGRHGPFYGYVTYLREALPEPAGVHYGDGGHDPQFFREVAPADARYIGRALG